VKQEGAQSTAIARTAYEPSASGRENVLETATPQDGRRRALVARVVSSHHAWLDVGRALSWPMAERERTARALATSERRARRLIDSNVIGVAFADGDRLTETNDEFLRTIGCSRADLEAGRLSWQDIAPPEYRDLDDRRLAELERRGECTPFEGEYRRKDGTRVPVLVGVALVNRSPLECVAFVLDLTARKRLETELRASSERLRTLVSDRKQAEEERAEASRVKDDFLATLAHELRSPVTSILLWMRLLRRGQLDVAGTARAVDAIERGARQLSQLVEDVLDVARIDSGKVSMQVTCVDLHSIVAAALEAFRPAVEANHLQLEALLDPSETTVRGDPVRLHQILNNLLTNAIKFTPDGGRITVELARAGPAARITVSDTGRGIAPEFLPRVFERFQQAAPAGQRQNGLGLGLGIARYLVEQHGGTIAAASPGLGQGATFSVTLPLAPEEAEVSWAFAPHPAEERQAVDR
jgi:PAS domain S-box-containing protein